MALPAGLSDLFSPECPAERHVNRPAFSLLDVQECPVLCSPDLVRHCHKATTVGWDRGFWVLLFRVQMNLTTKVMPPRPVVEELAYFQGCRYHCVTL